MLITYEKRLSQTPHLESPTQLLKTKEVIELYPALTLYSINKAIKENKLPVIKIGNLNYFTKDTIENYIASQEKKGDFE